MTRNALWTARLGLNRLDDRCLPSALGMTQSAMSLRPRGFEAIKERIKIEPTAEQSRAASTGELLADCPTIGANSDDDLNTAPPAADAPVDRLPRKFKSATIVVLANVA